eukprot:TRINITY_DN3871_c0_g1_i3.p1 TRINITY_DN3871_c0_g1~~TRINITY_DN3871_c0_g1_i3.p1  ORF type:complete len:791 (-),score=125.00 TRINITY_DN3871_c0_g1_i3:409-2721(-)
MADRGGSTKGAISTSEALFNSVASVRPILHADARSFARRAPECWAGLWLTALRAIKEGTGDEADIEVFWKFVARFALLDTKLRNRQLLEVVSAASSNQLWGQRFWASWHGFQAAVPNTETLSGSLPLAVWKLAMPTRPESLDSCAAVVASLLKFSPSEAATSAWLAAAPPEFLERLRASSSVKLPDMCGSNACVLSSKPEDKCEQPAAAAENTCEDRPPGKLQRFASDVAIPQARPEVEQSLREQEEQRAETDCDTEESDGGSEQAGGTDDRSETERTTLQHPPSSRHSVVDEGATENPAASMQSPAHQQPAEAAPAPADPNSDGAITASAGNSPGRPPAEAPPQSSDGAIITSASYSPGRSPAEVPPQADGGSQSSDGCGRRPSSEDYRLKVLEIRSAVLRLHTRLSEAALSDEIVGSQEAAAAFAAPPAPAQADMPLPAKPAATSTHEPMSSQAGACVQEARNGGVPSSVKQETKESFRSQRSTLCSASALNTQDRQMEVPTRSSCLRKRGGTSQSRTGRPPATPQAAVPPGPAAAALNPAAKEAMSSLHPATSQALKHDQTLHASGSADREPEQSLVKMEATAGNQLDGTPTSFARGSGAGMCGFLCELLRRRVGQNRIVRGLKSCTTGRSRRDAGDLSPPCMRRRRNSSRRPRARPMRCLAMLALCLWRCTFRMRHRYRYLAGCSKCMEEATPCFLPAAAAAATGLFRRSTRVLRIGLRLPLQLLSPRPWTLTRRKLLSKRVTLQSQRLQMRMFHCRNLLRRKHRW